MGQGPTKNHASKKLRGRTADGPPRLPTFGLRSRMTRAPTIGLAPTNLSSADIVALRLTLLRCEAHITSRTVG